MLFSQSELRAIADALGDTDDALTGSEIGHLLQTARMGDPDSSNTKRHRLYNAFAAHQNVSQDRTNILAFIRFAMKPAIYARTPGRFEPMRTKLNRALAFSGLSVNAAGEIHLTEKAKTLSEAEQRAQDLRADLTLRDVHPDILKFCREELLRENYFHAVLEAAKSVADKLRSKTGLTDDGATLVDRALGGVMPMLVINAFSDESEKSEQKGFVMLVKGAFGMFRNTTAHAPKIKWAVNKRDAEEAFGVLSLIHKRLDATKMLPRV